ncbi:HD domain-containing phosphohydrolase [Chloroflexus sp.]|uniref:HD domain-containing phosphohydrolase n=1 Tax=Chloroflexus sp. TaxID=1904827 RepID=UPI003C742CC5
MFPVEVSSTGADIDGERVLLSVIRDISERKQVQAELDLLRRALIASDQAIVITDSNSVIEWVNPAFTALTGYHAEEAIGRHTRILRSGKQDQAFYATMWAEILSGRTWRGTLINRRKDGSRYHEELAITPVKQENGVIAHFITVKQDISVRVQREQQQRALRQLSAAMRVAQSCAELMQTVVHELQALAAAQSVVFWRFKDEGWQIEQLAGEAIRFDWVADRLATVGSDTIPSEPTPPIVLPGGELVVVPLTGSVCPEYRLWVAITLLASEPFSAVTIELLRATTEIIGNALYRTELFEKVQQANAELRQAYDATIEGWARALDLRDHETEGHSRRVTELTMQIAARMGFGAEELVYIRWGALLHDIGKMGIPDAILRKPGPLDEQEWAIMRTHPTLAVELLRPISFLAPALDIPWCHHEKWDGTGYPRGLRGEEIPLAARIFAVVDVYDRSVCFALRHTSESCLAVG